MGTPDYQSWIEQSMELSPSCPVRNTYNLAGYMWLSWLPAWCWCGCTQSGLLHCQTEQEEMGHLACLL